MAKPKGPTGLSFSVAAKGTGSAAPKGTGLSFSPVSRTAAAAGAPTQVPQLGLSATPRAGRAAATGTPKVPQLGLSATPRASRSSHGGSRVGSGRRSASEGVVARLLMGRAGNSRAAPPSKDDCTHVTLIDFITKELPKGGQFLAVRIHGYSLLRQTEPSATNPSGSLTIRVHILIYLEKNSILLNGKRSFLFACSSIPRNP
jgi:hypothetical protein